MCEEGSLETDENQTANVIQNYSDERLGETANPLWCINKKKRGESRDVKSVRRGHVNTSKRKRKAKQKKKRYR